MIEVKNKNIPENEYSVIRKVKKAYRNCSIFAIVYSFALCFCGLFDDVLDIGILLIIIANFVGTFLIIPLAFVFKILTEIKNRRDVDFNGIYCRELPEKVKPAVIAYKMQGKNVDNTDVTATLLDLIRRKVLIVENESVNIFDVDSLGNDENLILRFNKYDADISGYEIHLINWFITNSDKGILKIELKKVREEKFKEEASNKEYEEFSKLVGKEVKNKNKEYSSKGIMAKFSRILNKMSTVLIIIGIILYLCTFIMIAMEETLIELLPSSDLYGEVSVGFIIFSFIIPLIAVIIRTMKVPEQYLSDTEAEMRRKWNGYRNYIKDYTIMNKRESISEVFLWEEYLVYSVAFGDATVMIEKMRKLYGFKLV